MSIPKTLRLRCGCLTVWNDAEGQYNSQCRTPAHLKARRHAERLALQRSHDDLKRRQDMPLYRRSFSILR